MRFDAIHRRPIGWPVWPAATIVWCAIGLLPSLFATLQAADDATPGDVAERTNPARSKPQLARFFEQEIEPILRKRCWKCHGEGDAIKGELSLRSREDVLRGGESGPAVSIDEPSSSLLLEAVRYDGVEMPPDRQLSDGEIRKLERWVESSVPWTPGKERSRVIRRASRFEQRMAAARDHWAYQPIAPVTPPAVARSWCINPIDAFVARGHAARGLQPVPPASKVALLRRVYYDLIGLPPSPQVVRSFLADRSPQAYERVVDRLLASPQYGVRWGRHWLDLVRYAETNSYERDAAKPFVWRYRDYVIDSFNRDKPYDVFVREQLAGDEYVPVRPEARIATGFYRLGIWDDEPVDREQALYDDLDDIVVTTSQVFLGVNIGCARCHEHKIDPIPQRDYYRFLAFFNGVTRYGVRASETVARNSIRSLATEEQRQRLAARRAEHERRLRHVRARMAAIESIVKPDFVPVEHEEFKHRQHRIPILRKRVPGKLSRDKLEEYIELSRAEEQLLRNVLPGLEKALCVTEIGPKPRETFVLIRGSARAKGDRVAPGFPVALGDTPLGTIEPLAESSGRRRALAEWITASDNPLTARVIVNRLWHYHFGRGIVRTPSDFGFGGSRPTHPELLDYLAGELMRHEWRLKPIHRMILLSATYRMGSSNRPEMARVDSANDGLWRFPPRRLDAESIRDSVLAVTGRLNPQLGGPSVFVAIPKEVLAGQSRPGSGWGKSPDAQASRRSVFIHVKRSLVPPILAAFDGADTDASCPRRYVSTQPTQTLLMLNSEFLQQQSRRLAASLQQTAGDRLKDQIAEGLWRVTQRPPTEREIDRGLRLIRRLVDDRGLSRRQAMAYYCLVLLNLNEFLYLD